MSRGKEPIALMYEGPQWSDISVSEVSQLPKLAKHIITSNPRFLTRSHHSHVYLIDITDHGTTSKAILKVFPKQLKERYNKEVDAYRFLYHYNVPDQGIVPKIFGVIPTLNKKAIGKLLGESMPEDAPIALPAAAVVMEYIQGAQPASPKNMTLVTAKRALDGLRTIHEAHVLHEDAEARNLLVFPEAERAVWIDFSSATINRDVSMALDEHDLLKELLYRRLVFASYNVG